jgi:hypothetical protein
MPLPGSIRENGMGKDDDAFNQLIASLGAVLALTEDGQSLGSGLNIPYAIDVVAIRNKTGLAGFGYCQVGDSRGVWQNLGHEHDVQPLSRVPLSS